MQVQINDNQVDVDITAVKSVPDLVEFVKSIIDPETIITELKINNFSLTENDWHMPLVAMLNRKISFVTGPLNEYVKDRISNAPSLVDEITVEFSTASNAFHSGASQEGNIHFVNAVKDLNEFLKWYSSLLDLKPEMRNEQTKFLEDMNDLFKICETLHQQQVYQSWWNAGETINNQLKPKLAQIKTTCENAFSSLD
ncbi:MAG: hypothetical protein KBC84_05460 [Proteobacteria bacterium]|nr:hypothetical protein [Pseudomonadota bacterium]